MPGMVRVPFQDGESPIYLFRQHDERQFVCERHFSHRELQLRMLQCGFAKPVGGTDREQHRLRSPVLMLADERGEFFRRKLFTARIESNKERTWRYLVYPLQQRFFGGELLCLDLNVARSALVVVIAQRLNRGILGAADPRKLQLHTIPSILAALVMFLRLRLLRFWRGRGRLYFRWRLGQQLLQEALRQIGAELGFSAVLLDLDAVEEGLHVGVGSAGA